MYIMMEMLSFYVATFDNPVLKYALSSWFAQTRCEMNTKNINHSERKGVKSKLQIVVMLSFFDVSITGPVEFCL